RELKVEGLVHVSYLPQDYYHRDPTGTKLVGQRTGRTYRLADTLEVRLVNANVEERKIDFVPVERADDAAQAANGGHGQGLFRRRRGRGTCPRPLRPTCGLSRSRRCRRIGDDGPAHLWRARGPRGGEPSAGRDR